MEDNLEDLREDENEEIAQIAYSYWETRGREDGHDMEDWLLAEQEVIRRREVRTKGARAEGDGRTQRRTTAA